MEDIVAVIPARSGSKGVPDKNIKLLGGHPLIAYSVSVAFLAGIKEVIVSTDSEKYAEIARSYGAKVPFLRNKEISTDTSSDFDFMFHCMDWYSRNSNTCPEYFVHLRPTTPLREANILKEAIKIIRARKDIHSLRSAHAVAESPFKWFLKDKDNLFRGLREDLTPEKVNEPRQNFPTMYIPNGYVDIVRLSHVLYSNNLHGNKMYVFETPQCTEVDRFEDFDYLEYELTKKKSLLTEHFQNIT
jgi:CMP-N,N'-diacetyllegionaminic acid synthase